MKLSKGYNKTAFKVKEIKTGKMYDCFIQSYPKENGTYYSRINIGINGFNEWNFCFYVSQDDFNNEFEII